MNKIFCALVVLILTGCATAYQPKGLTGGYKDKEISPGKFEVYFLGNGVTSFEKVTEYWHKRAGELCQGKKYTYEYTDTKSLNSSTVIASAGTFVPISMSYPQLLGVVECAAN